MTVVRRRVKKLNDLIKNISKFCAIIITSLLSTLLIVMILSIAVSVSAFFLIIDSLETVSEITIPEPEKERSSYIYSINGDTGEYDIIYKATPYTGNIRIEIETDTLPQYVKDAFVSIEDERFYSHDGVDIKTTFAAFAKEMLRISGFISSDMTGGSTITQQLVKNITSDNEISIDRKIREIFRAVSLEKHYTKDEILGKYLNLIYFGQTEDGYNMYGIEAAAAGYFGKHASELTIPEAAALAAIPQAPYLRDPFVNMEGNTERRLYCLRKMFQLGFISSDEYENSVRQKLHLVHPDDEGEFIKISEYPVDFKNPEVTSWVIDTAVDEFCSYMCESKNIGYDEAMELFMNGGYELYLTADSRVQAALEENYADYKYFPENEAEYINSDGETEYEQVQSAIVVMDYSGKIKGIVGRIGEKTESFCWNNATDAHRQPGSAIKPVTTYGYALENDFITWSTLFTDVPLPAGTAEEGMWPFNYGGGYTGKQYPVCQLLADSFNTVPAQLCYNLGIQNIFDFSTKKLRLSLNKETDLTYAALSVGATGTGPSLVNLANAYMPFGNGGIYKKAHIISRIKDSASSRVYLENDARNGEQVISKETAFIMNRLLREVVTKGTGRKALLSNKENIGKTGTAENYRDIVFAGLTEDFVSAIWIGYEHGENPYALQYSSSAEIWKNVFGNFADGFISDARYPECDTVIYTDFCKETGLPASKKCTSGGKGYYKSGTIEYCKKNHKKNIEENNSSDLTN